MIAILSKSSKAWTAASVLSCVMLANTFTAQAMEPSDEAGRVRPIKKRHWDNQTKVWLARSCVGEAGFWNPDECMAIAWIYAKRSSMNGWPLLKMIRRYSAAVKNRDVHTRKWLFELDLAGNKPKNWPGTISWKRHKKAWMNILNMLDDWENGHVKDPIPSADHFGSFQDAKQSCRVQMWKRLNTPEGFKNLYFNSSQRNAVKAKYNKYTRYMMNGRN